MEFVPADVQGIHLLLRHPDALLADGLVQRAGHLQAGVGRGRRR